MKYRELKYLTESIEFKRIIDKYNFQLHIDNRLKRHRIFFISKCFIFKIYGFIVENCFYFDIYSVDLKIYTSLSRLLSDCDSEKLCQIPQTKMDKSNHALIPKLQGNEKNTLEAERYFFRKIQLMDVFLEEIFLCEKKIDPKHYSGTFSYVKQDIGNFLNTL